MKCVITGEDTKTLTKGKPVSRRGRELIQDYLDRFALSDLKGIGLIMTRRMAMEDLYSGRDIMKEFNTAKEKREAIEKLKEEDDN